MEVYEVQFGRGAFTARGVQCTGPVFTMPSQVGARPEKGTGIRISTRAQGLGTKGRGEAGAGPPARVPIHVFSHSRALSRKRELPTTSETDIGTEVGESAPYAGQFEVTRF